MKDYIYIDKLFGNDYYSLILCEFTYEKDLLKKFIEVCDDGVNNKYTNETDTYDGICYRFAKSIITYAKSSYDNLILRHFDICEYFRFVEYNQYIF